ncbi:MAG: glycosyltransferase [Verrucomicrobiota bacterium]
MPDELKISVVIPTFNRGKVLVHSIEMLLDQTHRAHEIIIVDQSTEVPAEVAGRLRQWADAGAIQWIQQTEPNASMARNRGALASTGEVIVFLDDDIEVGRNFIQSYANAFADEQVRGVAGQVLEGNRETVDEIDPRVSDPEVGWLHWKRNYTRPIQGVFGISANMGVRRGDFFAIGGMDERFYRGAYREEGDFAQRWRKSGRLFHFRPDVSLFHLGAAGIPSGGQRHWTYRKPYLTGWHHYFGNWYFFLNHATWRTLPQFCRGFIHTAGFNRKDLRRPWLIPVHTIRWLSAFPYALWCRMRGPKLIGPDPLAAAHPGSESPK